MSNIDHSASVKYSNLFASSTQYQSILGNKDSCPVYYCNYNKAADENKKIFQRNIPKKHRPLSVPHRNGYMVCKKHIDLNLSETTRYKDQTNKSTDQSDTEHFTSNYHNTDLPVDNYDQHLLDEYYATHKDDIIFRMKKDGLYQGDEEVDKWNYMNRRWAENEHKQYNNTVEVSELPHQPNDIDIDSNLRQGFLHSECPDKRYKPKLCETVRVNTAELLDEPYCQNYKVYDFNDYTQSYCQSGKSVSKNTNKMYRNVNDISDHNILEFNYNNSLPTCFSSNLKSKSSISNIKNPVLFSVKRTTNVNNISTGPERVDHKYENIWNNSTKRRLI